jgi:hypothetical protein
VYTEAAASVHTATDGPCTPSGSAPGQNHRSSRVGPFPSQARLGPPTSSAALARPASGLAAPRLASPTAGRSRSRAALALPRRASPSPQAGPPPTEKARTRSITPSPRHEPCGSTSRAAVSHPGRRAFSGAPSRRTAPQTIASTKARHGVGPPTRKPREGYSWGASPPPRPPQKKVLVGRTSRAAKIIASLAMRLLGPRLAHRPVTPCHRAAGLGGPRESAHVVVTSPSPLPLALARRARCRSSFFRLRDQPPQARVPAASPPSFKKPSPDPSATANTRR